MEKKEAIRQRHKAIRDAMSDECVGKYSRSICERVLHSAWYKRSDIIYAYYPIGREVDCRPLIMKALLDGKTVALPRTGAIRTQTEFMVQGLPYGTKQRVTAHNMEFYRISSLEQLKEGRFHVMEPCIECPQIQDECAVVLVPGVVFDLQGNRYGYGKGYYDRYFARFPRLLRMGLAFENQIETMLEVCMTDIRMDCVYTETQIYTFTGAEEGFRYRE